MTSLLLPFCPFIRSHLILSNVMNFVEIITIFFVYERSGKYHVKLTSILVRSQVQTLIKMFKLTISARPYAQINVIYTICKREMKFWADLFIIPIIDLTIFLY